jgi:preprotein translocase subunit YajC
MLQKAHIVLFVIALLEVSPAAAQESAAAPSPIASMIPMLLIVGFIFYFMVIRPQEREIKRQKELLDGLKSGDEVVTSSGIIGRVAGVEKDYILLDVSKGAKLKFEPSHVAKRFERKQENPK